MTISFVRGRVLAVIASAFVLAGCSSLDLKKPRAVAKATDRNPAVRCLCLWQQAESEGLDGQPTRGFGGQIFFFPREGDLPVTVDGDVRVFLFDDVGTEEEQSRPLHEFDFVNGVWNESLQESQFGPVYSVFIPYVRGGTEETTCSLRVRLTRPDGTMVYSDLAEVKLAGTMRKTDTVRKNQPFTRPEADTDRLQVRQVNAVDTALASETIGVQDGTQMFRVEDRVRYVGQPPDAFKVPDERDARIEELEAKLAALGAQPQRRAYSGTAPTTPRPDIRRLFEEAAAEQQHPQLVEPARISVSDETARPITPADELRAALQAE